MDCFLLICTLRCSWPTGNFICEASLRCRFLFLRLLDTGQLVWETRGTLCIYTAYKPLKCVDSTAALDLASLLCKPNGATSTEYTWCHIRGSLQLSPLLRTPRAVRKVCHLIENATTPLGSRSISPDSRQFVDALITSQLRILHVRCLEYIVD